MNPAPLSFAPAFANQLGMLSLSAHAEVRMQQRGVERELLECLLEYGARQYDHKGCEVVFLTDDCLDAIARHESHHLLVRMAAARSIYAVVDVDGSVVTTGHRYRRVLRDLSLSSFRPGRSRKPRRRQSRPIWYQFN
jgi:hypothetical protein